MDLWINGMWVHDLTIDINTIMPRPLAVIEFLSFQGLLIHLYSVVSEILSLIGVAVRRIQRIYLYQPKVERRI